MTSIGTIGSIAAAVAAIVVPPDRMRRLRPDVVAQLAESISALGLLQPIVVRPKGARYNLVVGAHQLAAATQLGHASIAAIVLDGLDADAAQLAEIDENLIRADLSPAERALHVARRKELYEKLHPQTKRGGDRKSANAKSNRQNGDLKRFTKDAANKTGRSERTVQREIERAAKIIGLADVIGTPLDTADELDALAKLPSMVQRDLIARAKAGEKVKVSVTLKKLNRGCRERELAAATAAASQALGKKLYGVIYADPPWRYEHPPFGDDTRAGEQHYPTMTLDEIRALPVPAADNCVLFLWAMVPKLPEALEVMNADWCK